MLQFNKLQDRLLRFIRRTEYKLCVLGLLIYIILLGISMWHVSSFPFRISYKVEPPATPIKNKTTKEDFRIKETQKFLINTPGCYIPNYAMTFKYESSVKSSSDINNMCGVRLIFIDTIGDDKIQFRMENYTQENVTCCYQFVSESTIPGHEHDYLSYTPCEIFTNNSIIWLQQEVIIVSCKNSNKILYRDAYIILKKINEGNVQTEINNKMQWNVLMIGLDSMSRTRVFDTMPHTIKYLKKHKWLDFKAYQKVRSTTFQNLMSALTGKTMTTIYSNCTPDLDQCADYFIWEKYKDAGYKTAHGESNILSETFCNRFKKSPFDHYMRLLLLTMSSISGDISCREKKPSAIHLLEYAHKFIDSYKTNTFFGIFWMNTYDSFNDTPELADKQIVDFFHKINNSGVLKNTFVIFFSDQGTSFGEMGLPIESYYDNRLPMLFIWVPFKFRFLYTKKHYNLQTNQERLITPYDLYLTLVDVLKLSINSSKEIQSEACPQCNSLFENISENRTCADAGIGRHWCSCYYMWSIDDYADNLEYENSVFTALSHIQDMRTSIKTIPCTSCVNLHPSVHRAHKYYEGDKIYHVIAFHVSPNKLLFEAVVVHNDTLCKLQSLRTMTRYNDMGNCVLNSEDRPFCVCYYNNSCGHKVTTTSREPSAVQLSDVINFKMHITTPPNCNVTLNSGRKC